MCRREAPPAVGPAACAKQIEAITSEAEIHALDRALAVLFIDPGLGALIPGSHPELREYTDDVDDIRLIYYVTALRAVIVVAYVEA